MLFIANVKDAFGNAEVAANTSPYMDAESQTVCLEKNQTRKLKGWGRLQLVACEKGEIWITQKHDPMDYVLGKGDVFLVTFPGSVVVQALEKAQFTITKLAGPMACDGKSLHFS